MCESRSPPGYPIKQTPFLKRRAFCRLQINSQKNLSHPFHHQGSMHLIQHLALKTGTHKAYLPCLGVICSTMTLALRIFSNNFFCLVFRFREQVAVRDTQICQFAANDYFTFSADFYPDRCREMFECVAV